MTIHKTRAVDCQGSFSAKSPLTGALSDNKVYMEISSTNKEKDLKDTDSGDTKIYISDFFNPGGSCNWEAY